MLSHKPFATAPDSVSILSLVRFFPHKMNKESFAYWEYFFFPLAFRDTSEWSSNKAEVGFYLLASNSEYNRPKVWEKQKLLKVIQKEIKTLNKHIKEKKLIWNYFFPQNISASSPQNKTKQKPQQHKASQIASLINLVKY